MRTHLAALVDLVLPGGCAGCAVVRGPEPWCPACWSELGAPREVFLAGSLRVVAAGAYTGALRTALLRYKERGRRDLARPLAERLVALLPPPSAVPVLHLVPAPSRRSAARARGGDHVLRLCRAIAARRPGTCVHPALALGRGARDSVGLSPEERATNLAAHLRVRAAPPARVLLVDDVVTTGSTLMACRAALAGVGSATSGALTLCDATGTRGSRSGSAS